MIGALLTFPARATLRALVAFVSTEPVPTILFGRDEPFAYESATVLQIDGRRVVEAIARPERGCQ
jgi:hypothetical protein